MGKGMRVRESATFRRLDCAFPRAALTELFEMEMKEIKNGVQIEAIRSGPLATKLAKNSSSIIHRVMLIEEEHATRIILQMHEIVAKYPVNQSEYHRFGD